MYRTHSFHTTENGCALVLQKDITYWGVDELTMEPCCALKYYPEVDVLQSEKDGELKKKRKVLEQAAEEDFGTTEWAQWRSWLWNTIGNDDDDDDDDDNDGDGNRISLDF